MVCTLCSGDTEFESQHDMVMLSLCLTKYHAMKTYSLLN